MANKFDKDSVNQRLNFIVDSFEKGIKSAFATKIGISVQGVHDLLSGRKGYPSFKVLSSILESYPMLNANWLIMGRGPMLQDEVASAAGAPSIDAQIDAAELQLAQALVNNTAAKLARQKQTMELLDKESMRLTAQKAAIAERQAAGRTTDEDAAEYQQLNAQWLQVLEEKKELSGSIDFGTTLLAEYQAEYIELVNQRLGIQPPDMQG
jgi:hypothetical protein